MALLGRITNGPVAAEERHFMCDYSLHHVASRPANVGDKLMTTRFEMTSTRGFAAAAEPGVAVCLMPGTEIAFDEDVVYDRILGGGLLPPRRTRQRLARFRQVNVEFAVHHDALEFADGSIVLLTTLRPGQHATVLQLPASSARQAAKERKTFDADGRAEPSAPAVPPLRNGLR
jgi:hypothetical protein